MSSSSNSVWPSGAICWHWYGSSLAQVRLVALMTPSHYFNQCWIFINDILWHLPERIFTQVPKLLHVFSIRCLEIILFKLLPPLPGANELMASENLLTVKSCPYNKEIQDALIVLAGPCDRWPTRGCVWMECPPLVNQYVSSIHYLYYYSDDFFFFFFMMKCLIWHEWNWDIPQKLVLHLPDILLP